MSGLRVMVVLSDVNAGELVLGPFNQGVVLESVNVGSSSTTALIDVASKDVIARAFGSLWTRYDWAAQYAKVFVQGLPEEDV